MAGMTYPITVFYDGACSMCVAQMHKFREMDSQKRLIFVDISRPDFNQGASGLAGEPIERYIYVRDSSGHLARGVDAFIFMWMATDRKFLAWFVSLPIITQVGKFVYRLISRLRYLSGRKKDVCNFHCDKEI